MPSPLPPRRSRFAPALLLEGGYGVLPLLVAGLFVLGLVVYWWGLLASFDDKSADLERQTQLRSSQLAQTLALQSQTLFAGLDHVTQSLVTEFAAGNAAGFDRAVNTAITTFPAGAILQVAVAGRDGQVVYSNLQASRTGKSNASIRDRQHFLVHANVAPGAPDAGLYISQPLMGRVSNTWTLQLTRAIRIQGEFAGVVVISVAPSYLSGAFREVLEHPDDVIVLVRSDGAYMARSRDEEVVLGTFVPQEREFVRDLETRHGFYNAVSSVDSRERYYSWHRVGHLPLVLTMGLDKEAVLAPLQRDIRASLVRNGGVTAALVMAALWMGLLTLQRIRAKAEAARSAELLRNLVTQVPGALFQLRVHVGQGVMQFLYVSPGLYALHHVPDTGDASSVSGEAVLSAILPEDAQRVRAELIEAGAVLQPWQSSYRVPAPDGTVHWMRATARPERADGGGVLWHGYLQDVTDAHVLQEALRNSEEHLRLTMAAVHDGLWQWDIVTDQIQWDARCWEMLGHPAEAGDVVRSTMLAWMHPSDRDRFERKLVAHLEHGENYHNEFRLRKFSGEWLWVEARGEVTDRANGLPVRMRGTHTDISERVAKAQMLRAVLDESAASIFLATRGRRIEQVNRRAHNMFGHPGELLVGQSMRLIHVDEASFDAFAVCYEELREQGFARREWRFLLADGSVRWCDIHGTPLDPQEAEGSVIWTLVDIDDRHRAQTALRVAQKRLTAIIDRFPGGVMVQERLFGPVVAMNQAMCDLLGLHAPVTELTPALQERAQALLPAQMLLEPEPPLQAEPSAARGVEQVLPDGRTYEIYQVPLWDGARSLGLFWMLRDITERKQREFTLEQLAATDTLTTLPNRRSFMARMGQELQAITQAQSEPGVVLMIDIDFFKRVNDTWGHAIGDQVLKHLSALLRQSMRHGDMAGRLGGEEFAVLLAKTNLEGGLQLAERLRTRIELAAADTDQGPISFTVSVGVSVLDAQCPSVDESLVQADAALYTAKRTGRNRVCVWSEGMECTPPAAPPASSTAAQDGGAR